MFKNIRGLIKRFPHTPGIDASGIVYFSNSKKFKKNDKIFIIAKPLGVELNGSFSQFISVPDQWVNKLPKNLTSKETMMIGTSGFTAIKALNKTLKTILNNNHKPVLVTGASGNVGTFLIHMLKSYKISVEAISSNKGNERILKKIGVSKTYSLKKFLNAPNFSMLNEKYSVIFENLGGNLISICLKYLIKGGILVSIGNILSNTSTINILPLILRNVSIIGINAENSNANERKKIFDNFKKIKSDNFLINKTKTVSLKDAAKLIKVKNYKKKIKRLIIKF
jgi:acrylyl-CoA reductase (NADPH)